MKQHILSLSLLFALLAGIALTSTSYADRPNPPTIAGTVPAVIFRAGTNSAVIPPRILVIDERGKTVADVEATVVGLTATCTFEIPLKKAGTYVVVGYYPPPSTLKTMPQVVEVLRKSTSTVSLAWPPQ